MLFLFLVSPYLNYFSYLPPFRLPLTCCLRLFGALFDIFVPHGECPNES